MATRDSPIFCPTLVANTTHQIQRIPKECWIKDHLMKHQTSLDIARLRTFWIHPGGPQTIVQVALEESLLCHFYPLLALVLATLPGRSNRTPGGKDRQMCKHRCKHRFPIFPLGLLRAWLLIQALKVKICSIDQVMGDPPPAETFGALHPIPTPNEGSAGTRGSGKEGRSGIELRADLPSLRINFSSTWLVTLGQEGLLSMFETLDSCHSTRWPSELVTLAMELRVV